MNTIIFPATEKIETIDPDILPDQRAMLRAALGLLQTLEQAGYAAYIVGGFVRDVVMHTLGQSGLSHDIDIATNCPLPVLERLLTVCADVGRNREFNILLVENQGFRFEVAQLHTGVPHATPGNSALHTAGEALRCGPEDLLADLSVRDFRINAMALDASLRLHDPFAGRNDLAAGRLTCVNDPTARFTEDPLRMLRAVRFAVKFALQLGAPERDAIRQGGTRLALSAPERIWAELYAMASLDGPHCAAAVALLAECRLLERVLPEIAVLQRLHHNPAHHPEGSLSAPDGLRPGSVFDHVLAALRQNPDEDVTLNLALLFHDIGKGAVAHKVPGHDWHRFHGHDAAGVPLMRAVGQRLRLPNQLVDTLIFCIRNHMRVALFEEMRPHKILPVVSDPRWPLLRKVHFCDDACREGRFDLQRWQARMAAAETVLARKDAGAVVSGRQVLEVCGIKPGPLVGEIMRRTTARLINRTSCTPEDVRAEILRVYGRLYRH